MIDATAHVLEGWSQGELRVQHCDSCDTCQFPPRAVCLVCRAQTLGWKSIAREGTIGTFTVVYRAPTSAWKARVPYAIALVDCAPGVRLMMNVETAEPEALIIGQPVRIGFVTIGDDPQLRPIAWPKFE